MLISCFKKNIFFLIVATCIWSCGCSSSNHSGNEDDKIDTVYIIANDENADDEQPVSHHEHNHKSNDIDNDDWEVPTKMVECPICYGNRRCNVCGGGGIQYLWGEWTNCSSCDGNGLCAYCHGEGYIQEYGF